MQAAADRHPQTGKMVLTIQSGAFNVTVRASGEGADRKGSIWPMRFLPSNRRYEPAQKREVDLPGRGERQRRERVGKKRMWRSSPLWPRPRGRAGCEPGRWSMRDGLSTAVRSGTTGQSCRRSSTWHAAFPGHQHVAGMKNRSRVPSTRTRMLLSERWRRTVVADVMQIRSGFDGKAPEIAQVNRMSGNVLSDKDENQTESRRK